jgi:precorrin-2/cobalt-factor-2 C20-methyltransferase
MAGPEAMVAPAIFFGVGVGPGDPDLLTLKARRIIRKVPVIAYPRTDSGDSLARRIAAPHLPSGIVELPVALPMAIDREPARGAYDSAAEAIAIHLSAGCDVAFLCEGDPFFYGSFMYLHERLKRDFRCEVVPGVPSLTAAAAVAGRPLASRNDVMTVLPAPLDTDKLQAAIAGSDSVAIVKVGRHFPRIRALLRDAGLAERAVIVARATHPDQQITPLADIPEDAQPYFSTILLYKGSEPW